ncbi:winged helix-turn-helix domain-containing protein [Paeniglutamicibacter antarcticus]|uniref:Helix-turn-helix domain-containing protein n=1 Tax=Paeniglutamicibacter antarcticus TaxID=494023 RepID=A0ABP9TQ10_9MICC
MLDLEVIEDPRAAAAALDPMRQRLLLELHEPASASMLANRLEIPRQKITYHLNQMAGLGLVTEVELRRKGIMTERLMQATAASYMISPTSIAALSPAPESMKSEFSATWLLALAARTMREVGSLILGARKTGRTFGTFSIDADLVFANAHERAAFSRDLGLAVAELGAKYHDKNAVSGRAHRLVVAMHPTLKEGTP